MKDTPPRFSSEIMTQAELHNTHRTSGGIYQMSAPGILLLPSECLTFDEEAV
jgi:hypothetical protein